MPGPSGGSHGAGEAACAAGPRGPTRAEYEYCIEHPSLDGLHTDCSALLPDIPPKPSAAAKPAKPR